MIKLLFVLDNKLKTYLSIPQEMQINQTGGLDGRIQLSMVPHVQHYNMYSKHSILYVQHMNL